MDVHVWKMHQLIKWGGVYVHIIEILLLECDRDAMSLYMLLLGVFCIVQRAKVRFLQEK